MKQDKIYQLIWCLVLIILGLILSILGYMMYPTIAFVLIIGIFLFVYGIINIILSVK